MQMSRQILEAAAVVLVTLSFVVSGQSNFDYYTLSLQWPPSFCNVREAQVQPDKRCKDDMKYLDKFTIHGLWPSVDTGDQPAYCIPEDQLPSAIQLLQKIMPMRPKLLPIWPALVAGEGELEFWRKEWVKHGTCSEEYPKEEPEKYFEAAISLYNKVFPDDHVPKDMGINPGGTYRAGKLLDQVKKDYKYYPQFMCNYNPKTKTIQLLEIRLCFTGPPDSLEKLDCPAPRLGGECPYRSDEITLPAPPRSPPPPPPGSRGLTPPPPPSRWPPKGAEIQ